MPLSAFAISLDEINSNPNRYVKVIEEAEGTFYVDVSSIKSLRYSPPYYTMQFREIYIDYTMNLIADGSCTFNYDYNKSFLSRFGVQTRLHPSYTLRSIFNLASEDIKKDSGIISNSDSAACYNFNGVFDCTIDPLLGEKVIYGSNNYEIANFIFNKYYGMNFSA